ncbi:hypothetical protein D4R99_00595 [bacterium]|nr:MAG: hypothetical protein D4R99_00595 [bacterium]
MEQQPEKIQKVERLTEMPQEWQALRTKILENFESKTDGLDIERVKDFIKERNLSVTDFVIFEDEDIPLLQELFEKINNGKVRDAAVDFLSSESGGIYLQDMNLLLVRRYRNIEPLFEEGLLVHEMSHGSSEHLCYVRDSETEEITHPRAGFAIVGNEFSWGWLLEEGFADMMRGEYTEKNMLPENKEKILENLNEAGLSVVSGRLSLFPKGLDYEVPLKNVIRVTTSGISTTGDTAIASAALEMLCEKEPKLRQTLIEARSDIEKLRNVPKLINAIKPGLYLEIQKCGKGKAEFARVQNIIKEAIQNSK